MAACSISVKLDEPKRFRIGGEPITGTVVVEPEKDINCKALEVTCYWATHGRGNIARGEVQIETLFQGTWQGGQQYKYPFKLTTATWPPTYYGNYLNVSHFVEARAKVAWAIDPKSQQEFTLVAQESPADLAPTMNATKKSGWIGWLVGMIVLLVLVASLGPLLILMAFAVPLIAIGGGIYWLVRVYLPSQLLGAVQFEVQPKSVSVGQSIQGICEFTPRRSTTVNAITWTVRCVEKCSSGSGSNRKTHTNEVLCKSHTLAEAVVLRSGQAQKFAFSFSVPAAAPPSLKFTDNELIWTNELRIDIPKWPDFHKVLPMVVTVAADPSIPPVVERVAAVTLANDVDPWFTEVLNQVIQSQDDLDRMQTVVEAVNSHTFDIQVNFEDEAEEPIESDVEDEGIWVYALDQARNLPLVVFVPSTISPDTIPWTSNFRGKARVIGFESETNRVMLQLVQHGI